MLLEMNLFTAHNDHSSLSQSGRNSRIRQSQGILFSNSDPNFIIRVYLVGLSPVLQQFLQFILNQVDQLLLSWLKLIYGLQNLKLNKCLIEIQIISLLTR